MGEEVKGVVPWGLHPLDSWIVKELKNRSKEYGQNPNPTSSKPYSGPRTAWVRAFSNGISKMPGARDRDGFVLGGMFDFNNSLGFNDDKKSIIGVDAKGTPHTISQTGLEIVPRGTQPVRPPPSVSSIECELFGSQNASFPSLCRKVKINWKCYNLAQLNYLIPYFLTPRITLVVEWGWNNYDTISLVDLTDMEWVASMFTDPSYTLDFLKSSNGNYDAACGFITDFGYSLNEHGGYDCYTTITNANFLIEGQAIHNQSVSTKPNENSKPIPKKTLKEYVNNDLVNIDASNPDSMRLLREMGVDIRNIRYKIFDAGKETGNTKANEEKMKWIRMDLLVDIINAYTSVVMVGTNDQPKEAKETENGEGDGEPKPVRLNNLTIAGIKVNGHPALKSTNKHVLFPNELAPRLCTAAVERRNSGGNDIRTKNVEGTPYATLFPTVGAVLNQGYMDRSYDDLRKVINPNGDSFPVYRSINNAGGTLSPGYWGYLSDVFVSVELIKNLVDTNDTVKAFVESLLQNISQAMCNISQLKLIASEYGNKYYSIVDTNLSAINTVDAAAKLPRITVGATDSAYIRAAGFNVKISAEMMNQLVAQSTEQITTVTKDTKLGVINNDPKRPAPNRFSGGDRLFKYGALPNTVDSNTKGEAEEAAKQKQSEFAEKLADKKRMFVDDNKSFYIYSYGKGADVQKVILAENDPSYITQVVSGDYDENAAYMNNAIMPGTEFTMELLGISGITYLSQFTLDHVPEPYNYEHSVWQISDIKQKVENKVWTTTVTAQVRPLRTVKDRLP